MKRSFFHKRRYLLTGTAAVMCSMAVVGLPGIHPFRSLKEQTTRGLVSLPDGAFSVGSREAGSLGQPRITEVPGFLLGKHAVTVKEYTRYLNAVGDPTDMIPANIAFKRGRFMPAIRRKNHPVTGIMREDAEAYCHWLSESIGLRVRLPTETEWEFAARGGIHGARYPWGWGDPKGRAHFAERGPRRVGRYAPNAHGLYDMAGNVFEWCAGEAEDGMVPARGGSWAERDPSLLRVHRRTLFPKEYRDLDVGFRILVEP